jgi:hypothetical protein
MMIFIAVCLTCSVVEQKTRFETWVTRNDVNGVNLFLLPYLITLMAYLYSQWAPNVQIKYFMFDWSIYSIFVLNTVWKHDSLQMMIFVYVCSTYSIIELKTLIETWIARNDVNGVCWFRLSFLITIWHWSLHLNLLTMGTKCQNQVMYVWLVDLQTICTKYELETWLPPNDDIRICLLDMQRSWTKNIIWNLKSKKWSKWCILVSILIFNICLGSGH